jgi:hypothetical protein
MTASPAAGRIARDDGSVAEPAQALLRRIAPARSGACRGRLTVTVVRPGGLWVPGIPANTARVTFWRDPPDGV